MIVGSFLAAVGGLGSAFGMNVARVSKQPDNPNVWRELGHLSRVRTHKNRANFRVSVGCGSPTLVTHGGQGSADRSIHSYVRGGVSVLFVDITPAGRAGDFTAERNSLLPG